MRSVAEILSSQAARIFHAYLNGVGLNSCCLGLRKWRLIQGEVRFVRNIDIFCRNWFAEKFYNGHLFLFLLVLKFLFMSIYTMLNNFEINYL